MPRDAVGHWAIAGKFSNGKLGVVEIFACNGKAEKYIHVGTPMPKTLIFDPGDVSNEECSMLFAKAMKYVQTKKNKQNNLSLFSSK